MYTKWNGVLDNRLANPSDQFRCKFFVKLVAHLSSYISNKLLTAKEFDCFIDGAFNLKGIINNSDFKNGSKRRSPLQAQFLTRLNLLWKHLAVLNAKILEEPLYLKGIRLQIAINLMEEQHQLMSTITHLFLAFQVTIQLFNKNISQTMLQQVNTFIRDFKQPFHDNLESFNKLMVGLKSQDEVQHLQKKFPADVPLDLCDQIDELKDKFIEYHEAKHRSKDLGPDNFKLNELLNIDISICGIKIPIPFKVYANFHSNCHEHFDFVVSQKSFRDKLGQQYQAQRLRTNSDNKPAESNQNAAAGEVHRSRYRSISQKEFGSIILESKRRNSLSKENYKSINNMRTDKAGSFSLRNDQAVTQQDRIPSTTRESVISLDVGEKDFL